jgi:hypothetical protein
MSNIDHREVAETAFRRNPKRDEINEALKQEHARREAAVKNLYRLRALRLARDAKSDNRTHAQADQSWRVGYLYRVNKNGDAMYITPNGKLAAMVDAKGVVVAPTNRPPGVDCYGKTLDELRSNSRILDFQRTK